MKVAVLIALLLCCNSLIAKSTYDISGNDPVSPTIPSQVKFVLTFTPNDYKGNFPIKRAPATYNFLPQAWIEEQSLCLQGVTTIEGLHYDIINAEEQSLLSGTVVVRKGQTLTIPLASLPVGGYTLLLTIGEDSFAADFDL